MYVYIYRHIPLNVHVHISQLSSCEKAGVLAYSRDRFIFKTLASAWGVKDGLKRRAFQEFLQFYQLWEYKEFVKQKP